MTTRIDRILTTHVGSLPRPKDVVAVLFAQDKGEDVDPQHFDTTMRAAVKQAVRQQRDAGLDIVNDGEMSKIGYATYMRHRLNGFELGNAPRATPQDLDDYPDYRDRIAAEGATPKYVRPICRGPLSVKTLQLAQDDISRLKEALVGHNPAGSFISAPSPGTIAIFQPNEYYPTYEKYLEALTEVMRPEYEAIAAAGITLSVDCPDLGMGRHIRFRDVDDDEFIRNAEMQVEALNHALRNIPAEQTRMHICWGNYEGPHTRDIPLSKVLPTLLKVKPRGILLEGGNPRHEHEYELFATTKLPDDKVLVPGVLDTTTNFVEHPEVVAQRIRRYADLVGRERVIAGTDCGFGHFAGFGAVHPSICWAKMQSLVEGARIATKKLWS